MDINKFIYVNSEFEKKFSGPLSARWNTFKAYLNLVSTGLPGQPISLLETGCMRQLDDWGGGCSTWMFADFLQNYTQDGTLVSIDIAPQNLKVAEYAINEAVGPLESRTFDFKTLCGDSLAQLAQISVLPPAKDTRFEGIYLDSMDCDPRVPEGEEQTLESQQHQLNECRIALQLFSDKLPFKVLMLDDNNLPWGGKCRLTKKYLKSMFWTCVLDYQQSLWIQKNENFRVW